MAACLEPIGASPPLACGLWCSGIPLFLAARLACPDGVGDHRVVWSGGEFRGQLGRAVRHSLARTGCSAFARDTAIHTDKEIIFSGGRSSVRLRRFFARRAGLAAGWERNVVRARIRRTRRPGRTIARPTQGVRRFAAGRKHRATNGEFLAEDSSVDEIASRTE